MQEGPEHWTKVITPVLTASAWISRFMKPRSMRGALVKIWPRVTCWHTATLEAQHVLQLSQAAMGAASGRKYDNTLVKLAFIDEDLDAFEPPFGRSRFDKPWLFLWD